MNGIASLLDEPATTRTNHLWKELEDRCGLVGIKTSPFPHLSWQVAEAYDLSRQELNLSAFAKQSQILSIRTAGLGLFTGENPILYIPIIKDETLMRFHATLWEQMNGIAIHPSPLYAPDQWVPHITLAIDDITQHNLNCAIGYLVNQSLDWKISIDNLVSIVQAGEQPPKTVRYRFGP
jgi:2'-5' RNA ligase